MDKIDNIMFWIPRINILVIIIIISFPILNDIYKDYEDEQNNCIYGIYIGNEYTTDCENFYCNINGCYANKCDNGLEYEGTNLAGFKFCLYSGGKQ